MWTFHVCSFYVLPCRFCDKGTGKFNILLLCCQGDIKCSSSPAASITLGAESAKYLRRTKIKGAAW